MIPVDPDHAPRSAPPRVHEIQAVQRLCDLGVGFVQVLVWTDDDDDGPELEHVTDHVDGPLFDPRTNPVGRRVTARGGQIHMGPWPDGRRFVFVTTSGILPWSALRRAIDAVVVKNHATVVV